MRIYQTFIQVILLLISGALMAADITVTAIIGAVDNNDGLCSITEAIINANDDAQTHSDCLAGDGSDTITLTTNILLAEEYENDATWGRTGTPPITSTIILDGSDFSLSRHSGLLFCNKNAVSQESEFRLLRITDSGNLDLRDMGLSNGCVDGINGIGGAILNQGTLAIRNSQIHANRATFGGGITNTGVINLIENSDLSQNVADDGGGIQNRSLIGSIKNSTLGGNVAVNDGGGIHNGFGQIQNIQNNIFIYNSAFDGGAIDNAQSINVIQNNNFIQNSAMNEGGGINNSGFQPIITTIRNNAFIDNSAFMGGGFYNNNEIITIENNTFSGNSASFLGGGILNGNDITTTQNNTFSGNTANQGNAIYNWAIFETVQNNLFHDYSTCHDLFPVTSSNNLADSTSTGCAESDVLTASTVLPLSDNGCVTPLADGSCVMTHALTVGAEAIDAANVNTATQEDQRGYLANGLRDIGAYEYDGVIDLIFYDGFDQTIVVN